MFLFTAPLIVSVVLASAVTAVPSSRYGARAARRLASRSRLNNRLNQPTGGSSDVTVYSSNWAGAVWDQDNGTFTSVTGTFTVPNPEGNNNSAAAIWVGIDGDTCPSAVLQTGIDFTLSNGRASFDAWYEWYPYPSFDFTAIDICAGDIIRLTVTTSSAISGNTTIENLTKGQMVSESLSSVSALCQWNAEWIVEDFGQNGGLVPFANFTTVTFTNAIATDDNNTVYTPSGATIVNIQQSNQVLTSVSVSNDSVTIQYA